MKKVISVFLCIAILLSTAVIFCSAKNKDEEVPVVTVEAEELLGSRRNYPIIFVTGIGQSNSYRYDTVEDMQADIADDSTDRANASWNLFCNDFGFAFKDISLYPSLLAVVGGLLGTLFTGKNIIPESAVKKVVKTLFKYNIIDENGDLPETMYTPCYHKSVAKMTDDQKDTFYSRIPCKEVIEGVVKEDDLYVFNYSAFSFTFENSDNLATFINEVIADKKCEKVVLVPMSMGASVVSAYLHDHGTEGKVARVVSIVGAWDGSDVFSSLINQSYATNAPDMLYQNGNVLCELLGDDAYPWINLVIRLFRKAALRSVIDEIVNALVEEFIMKTPSLLALVPSAEYPAIRQSRLANHPELAYVMAQTDRYYQVQTNLKTTLTNLNNNYGVDFYFIAGYGLEFGGSEGGDYGFFKFMGSSATTNSDEIIQISSTVPGATYAPFNSQFDSAYLATHDSKYIPDDKSVDISTAYFKDQVFLFYNQKHELEYNNTALSVAFDCALGNIETSFGQDKYPVFNEGRNLRRLNRNYIPDLDRWLAKNTPTQEQQALIDANTKAVKEMKARTTNNIIEDKKVIENYRQMLITLGIYGPDSEESEDSFLSDACDKTYEIFGAKGFLDLFKKNA